MDIEEFDERLDWWLGNGVMFFSSSVVLLVGVSRLNTIPAVSTWAMCCLSCLVCCGFCAYYLSVIDGRYRGG